MYKKFFRGFRVSYIFLALIIVVSILSMFDYPQGLFFNKDGVYQTGIITALFALTCVGLSIDYGNIREHDAQDARRNLEQFKQDLHENELNIQNKFIIDQNSKRAQFEESIAKREIDANIRAKARIQWIENVRVKYTEYISSIYVIINSQNNRNRSKLIEELNKNMILLTLYFGNDGDRIDTEKMIVSKQNNGIGISDSAYKAIHNNKDNSNKNDFIVEYIQALTKTIVFEIDLPLKKEISQTFPYLSVGKTYNNSGDTSKLESQMLINGKKVSDSVDRIFHSPKSLLTYGELTVETSRDEKTYRSCNHSLIFERMITDLNDVIRLYLKLEWNIAKYGK